MSGKRGKGDRDGKGEKKFPLVPVLVIGGVALLVVGAIVAIVIAIVCWRKRVHNLKTASKNKPNEQLGNKNSNYPELEFTGSL